MNMRYVKISEEDMQIAEDFFENEKHYNEWFCAVGAYYRGKNFQIKTKIVQKYFNSYKKTMDRVIKGRETGGIRNQKENTESIENEFNNNNYPNTNHYTQPNTEHNTQINKINKIK